MLHIVGTKGQVVIAKEIRDRLGLKPGWAALQRLVGDRVEISFIPPPHGESLRGSLAAHIKRSVPPGEEWDAAREAAWREVGRSETRSADPDP